MTLTLVSVGLASHLDLSLRAIEAARGAHVVYAETYTMKLDTDVETLEKIINEPAEVLHGAPYNTSVRRVDEALAARSMVFRWHDLGEPGE